LVGIAATAAMVSIPGIATQLKENRNSTLEKDAVPTVSR
jgi:hypothetical protein